MKSEKRARRPSMVRFFIFSCCSLVALIRCSGDAVPSAAQEQEPEPAPQAASTQDEMARIPAGQFIFGTNEEGFQAYVSGMRVSFPGMLDAIRARFIIPQQILELSAFSIDRFETTNEQFAAFLESTSYRPASDADYLKHWDRPGREHPEWSASFPVVWVSREDAQAYCGWRGARLPTEQEWEKAARGASGRFFPWGDEIETGEEANAASDRLEPAGNRPGDVSPYRVYDLGGNASEWTSTRASASGRDLAVVRGGSFLGGFNEMLTFNRSLTDPGARQENLGFRCAANP